MTKTEKTEKAVALGDIARDYAILAMSRGIVAGCCVSQKIHSEDHVFRREWPATVTRDYATLSMSRVIAIMTCDYANLALSRGIVARNTW